jgi:hypothetical protein
MCPVALEGAMKVTNKAQYDPDTANKLQRPNKVNGLVQDIVGSPQLSNAAGWCLFEDPNLKYENCLIACGM